MNSQLCAVEGYGERPLILDTYCGAGGCSMGYYQAGFRVIGVDNDPMSLRHYPFPYLCDDALETLTGLTAGERLECSDGHSYGLEDIAAIHASPPCQYYSRLRYLPWVRDKVYWRSIPPTREALRATGKPYIIENVGDAVWDMETPFIICGQALGLSLYRHRAFETSGFGLFQPGHLKHTSVIDAGAASLGKRHHGLNGWNGVAGHQSGIERHRFMMGIDWMTGEELAQAVPPIMTRFVGTQLRAHLGVQGG